MSLRLDELLHHLVILKPDKAWLLDHGAACHGTLLKDSAAKYKAIFHEIIQVDILRLPDAHIEEAKGV